MQRQQHQPDPHKGSTCPLACVRASTPHDNARKQQKRRKPTHAHCDDPGSHCRSDIGAKQHHLRHAGQDEVTLDEGRDHEGGGGRTLKRDGRDKAGKEGARTIARSGRQTRLQASTEGALHAVTHQTETEQKQGHGAEEIDADDRRIHGLSPERYCLPRINSARKSR
ncbi:hypothetical protein D9M69_560410 [compost metagenome]